MVGSICRHFCRRRAAAVPEQSESKDYHWQILRSRDAETTGDQRINSFGIGGTMELRSGLLYQKQIIKRQSHTSVWGNARRQMRCASSGPTALRRASSISKATPASAPNSD
jgi:hypothetical protein